MDKGCIKYSLVLESKKGNFDIIPITELGFKGSYNIGEIDNFTKDYTEEELRELVRTNNIVENQYIDGQFKIISNVNHRLNPLTKEVYTKVRQFQYSNEEIDKELANYIFNKYRDALYKILKDKNIIQKFLEEFKKLKDNRDKEGIFRVILNLEYSKSRDIYLGIYNRLKEKENKYNKEKNRILEKLNAA